MTWGHLSLLEVSFQVQGGCKRDDFWVKIQLFYNGAIIGRKIFLAWGEMIKTQYQAMGKSLVSVSLLHPGVIPGSGAFKNVRFVDKKSAKINPKKQFPHCLTKPVKRPGSFEGKSSKMCWGDAP